MKREGRLHEYEEAMKENEQNGNASNEAISKCEFLNEVNLHSMSEMVGGQIIHGANFPAGMIPAALLSHNQHVSIPGKHHDLAILSDIPLNAETPAHLLDDDLTPNHKFYVRNNGLAPTLESINIDTWTLTIEGEAVPHPKIYSLHELKTKFKHHTYQLTIECAGNGRKDFDPPTPGNQWTVGAVGCAAFTGIRLADVLRDCGISSNAQYIGYYGADRHHDGTEVVPISRGVPIHKAFEDESLIAWATQDGDLELNNGYPLRLVFGGWPASCSGKWLKRIVVRDRIHDGEKMTGMYYKVPCEPMVAGAYITEDKMEIIGAMPVKSLITSPRSGTTINQNQILNVRGHAWVGDRMVKEVSCSVDFGKTWQSCELDPPANRQAWQHFRTQFQFSDKGYYEIWVRATDDHGISQPVLTPAWNPEGYLGNACHRIAILVK